MTIESIRVRLAALARDRAALVAVRANPAEAKAAVHAWTAGAAAAGAELLRDAVSGIANRGVFRPRGVFEQTAMAVAQSGIDFAPLLCALFGPKKIADALCAHLDSVPDAESRDERAARIAEIDAQIVRLETIEEALIVESERGDAPILRRTDADPAVVLMPHDALMAAYESALRVEGQAA